MFLVGRIQDSGHKIVLCANLIRRQAVFYFFFGGGIQEYFFRGMCVFCTVICKIFHYQTYVHICQLRIMVSSRLKGGLERVHYVGVLWVNLLPVRLKSPRISTF